MSEITLKPCPFCGAKAYAVHRAWVFAEHWEIQTECAEGCINYGIEPEFGTEEEAEKAWNRRAERTCRADLTEDRGEGHPWRTWECSACGGTYEDVNGRYERCPHCGARVVDVE